MEKLCSDFDRNVDYLDEYFGINKSFDIVRKNIIFASSEAAVYFIDGFLKDSSIERILNFMLSQKTLPDAVQNSAENFASMLIPYAECDIENDISKITTALLSGAAVIITNLFDYAIIADTRSYPVRSIKEPENDRVLRGAHVGFVETLIFNTALIRRHVRNKDLRIELLRIGEDTKTDVALCYVEGRVDQKELNELKNKLKNIRTRSLCMSHQSLAEILFPKKWYNPYPKVRYTERPDAAAATLLEGKMLVLCDNSPAAMILPSSLIEFIQESDDYYFPPFTGSYLKILRIITALLTVYLTPIWFLLVSNPDYIPSWLGFIKITKEYPVPIFLQLMLTEFAIDGLKMASLNTPDTLSNSLGIIGGLIIGDFASTLGFIAPDVIFYMAFVAVANYTQASYELGYALKFSRLLLLIFVSLFGIYGLICGVILINVAIATSSKNYLYPLIPFDGKALKRLIFRTRILKK